MFSVCGSVREIEVFKVAVSFSLSLFFTILSLFGFSEGEKRNYFSETNIMLFREERGIQKSIIRLFKFSGRYCDRCINVLTNMAMPESLKLLK